MNGQPENGTPPAANRCKCGPKSYLPEPVGELEAHDSHNDNDGDDDRHQDSDLRSVENYRTVIENDLSRHLGALL